MRPAPTLGTGDPVIETLHRLAAEQGRSIGQTAFVLRFG
jgi:hypothetical protein